MSWETNFDNIPGNVNSYLEGGVGHWKPEK